MGTYLTLGQAKQNIIPVSMPRGRSGSTNGQGVDRVENFSLVRDVNRDREERGALHSEKQHHSKFHSHKL